MDRRKLLKSGSLLLAASAMGGAGKVAAANAPRKPVLTIAHITDVHLPAEEAVKARFRQCLEAVKDRKPDFILNGGDAIMDASYDNVSRDKVTAQWAAWDDCISVLKGYELHSCLGNHDMWWAAPDKSDAMYGKDYVVKRLKIPHRYYSFAKSGWHFIITDGNNSKTTLDDEQYQWLEKELAGLKPNTPVLLMSHFPVFGATPVLVGGNHSDNKKLKDLFYQHKDKVKVMLAGHNHLYDKVMYNGVWYCCNGAMSGFWWGKGDKESAGPGYYLETPPGFAIIKLYEDGTVENEYLSHSF
ncbi:metallophosphoesterase [Chitinophaga sedimenti]|uniref:metallophosphoesterase family protein n=1 Tax=Chitinophaga sedimenti TaxID=2033606 RepID=UPI002005EEEB|nr:metallophosphoesterase [Chitinophaga sedimenti]MCK7556506.1 metallophosphoesterase [Chitinophaga sedimenti]